MLGIRQGKVGLFYATDPFDPDTFCCGETDDAARQDAAAAKQATPQALSIPGHICHEYPEDGHFLRVQVPDPQSMTGEQRYETIEVLQEMVRAWLTLPQVRS